MVGNGYVRLYNMLVLHVSGISIRVSNWHFYGGDSREVIIIVVNKVSVWVMDWCFRASNNWLKLLTRTDRGKSPGGKL